MNGNMEISTSANSAKKYERLLPFIISFLLPGLNILNNSLLRDNIAAIDVVPRWLLVFLFLLSLWHSNKAITDRIKGAKSYLFVIAGNTILIGVFLLAETYVFPSFLELAIDVPIWTMGLKFYLASALFLTVQNTLKYAKEKERLQSENFALQSENYKAQLEQLRKQVNPHFLFNSLSTLRTIIRANDKQSEDFVLNLSDVYRQILQTRESNSVSLKEELDFLNAYLYLIQIRHGKGLEISIEPRNESMGYSLPVFALQLLVENCTKHNIISESKPLKIRIYQQDPLSVTVENNYQPKKTEIKSLGVGMQNLKERYKLLGVENGVAIFQDDKVYSVTLKLF